MKTKTTKKTPRPRLQEAGAPQSAEQRAQGAGNYFSAPKTNLEFISTGCHVLDLALGGGWCENRVSNIVGDKAVGKSLLCIEACANFARKHPEGRIKYRESEHAFDVPYATALGLPEDRVDFGERPLETVEDLFEDLTQALASSKGPELYICDSLDALSDRAEMERDMNEGSYGTAKAKLLSQLFRRLVGAMAEKQLTLIIVSQVRSKIGVTFGRSTTRTGGRALDFYASQVLYLSHIETLYRTIKKQKRATGITVRGKLDKNKVGLPFREAEFDIVFGYGVDDESASKAWLTDIGITDAPVDQTELKALVTKHWYEIESTLLPTKRKYSDV